MRARMIGELNQVIVRRAPKTVEGFPLSTNHYSVTQASATQTAVIERAMISLAMSEATAHWRGGGKNEDADNAGK